MDKLKTTFLFVYLLTCPLLLWAEEDVEGYNEHTIRSSDIPTDAPKFEDYPAKEYEGKHALPHLKSGVGHQYRTRLSAWAKEEINFAGHFILATWGCGTNCTQIMLIDVKNGHVYSPEGASFNDATNIHADIIKGGDFWHADNAIRFQRDSQLLILIGAPEEVEKNRGISYFVWKQNKLHRVRFIPKP